MGTEAKLRIAVLCPISPTMLELQEDSLTCDGYDRKLDRDICFLRSVCLSYFCWAYTHTLEQPKEEYLRCNFWLPLFLKHNYNVVIGADLQRANSVQGTAVFSQRQPFVSINKGLVPRILFLCFEIQPADWDSLYCLTRVPCQPQASIERRGRWASPAPQEQHPSDNLKNAAKLTQEAVRSTFDEGAFRRCPEKKGCVDTPYEGGSDVSGTTNSESQASTSIGINIDFSVQEDDTKLRPTECFWKTLLFMPEAHPWRYTSTF